MFLTVSRIAPLGLGVFFSVLFFNAALSKFFPFVSFLDELLMAVSLIMAFVSVTEPRWFGSSRPLGIYIVWVFVSFVAISLLDVADLRDVSLNRFFVVLLGSATHIKLFLFVFFVCICTEKRWLRIEPLLTAFLVATLLGYLLNWSAETAFTRLFGSNEIERYGVYRKTGFHLVTVAGVIFYALLAIDFLFQKIKSRAFWSLFGLFWFVSLLIFSITTTRTVFVIAGLGSLFLMVERYGISRISALILVGGGVLLLGAPLVDINVTDDAFLDAFELIESMFLEPDLSSSRSIMFFYGKELAGEYFPVGVGVGNYASSFAESSKIYDNLHLSAYYFMAEYNGVLDSNASSILGELGVFGVIAFGIGLCKLGGRLRWVRKGAKELVFILVMIFLLAFFAPVFIKVDYCILIALIIARVRIRLLEQVS